MSTMISLADRTVGELAAEMPASIRVFEAWRIDYCCGGLTPLPDACAAAGRSVDEFMTALESVARVPDTLAFDWAGKPLGDVSARIVDSYHRYTREELQTLGTLAEKVLGVHGERHPELRRVAALVQDLATDLYPHMLKEEQVLFPYVAELEAGNAPTPFFGTVKNPIKMMMLEHDRVGELLGRLGEVTSGYAIPDNACFSYRELYRRLEELEQKTHEHVHVENNIYFPRAVALEEQVGNTVSFGDRCGTSFCGGH